MVKNQDADVQLLSINKGKQKADEFELWTKLKIPKQEEEEDMDIDVGDLKIGDEMKNYSNDTKRVCQFCHKVFSSGKALGGHMRIHVQSAANKKYPASKARQTIKFNKENPREEVGERVKKTACIICGKDFASMKSLFGHMRCHPERDWRGINPPSNTSSSNSSSLSEVVDDDGKKVLACRTVDLTESLSGWTVTARRGREALKGASSSMELSSLEDDMELLDAANDLMLLSRGDSPPEAEAANSFCKAKAVEKADKEMLEDLEHNYLSDDDQMDSKNELINDGDFKMVNKNKKKRKKMKLCDLDTVKSASPVTCDKYKCNTCDKSFQTYQALGGHRSSHNKFTIVIRNSVEEDGNTSNAIAQVEENNNICSKNSSTTDQGLGEGPSSRAPLPLPSDEVKSVLDFDLNELPPPEDVEATW